MRTLWFTAFFASFALGAATVAHAQDYPPSTQQDGQNPETAPVPEQEQQQQSPPFGQQTPEQQAQDQQGEVQGRITAVDHLNRSVTITPQDGQQVEVRVPENAQITVDGIPTPSMGLIREGQFVRASLSEGNTAQNLEIRVRQYSTDEE